MEKNNKFISIVKKNIYTILLFLIIILGFFLRVYKVDSNPPALFSDEADIGYQAFVFNQRHTDYYGNKYPIHFHSDSDWQPSLMIYSVSFAQRFFGVNEFSNRFPSVIYGTLTIIAFYFLIKTIFTNRNVSLIGAILLAASPWHIHFSRTTFGVSGMLLMMILGLDFLLRFVKKRNFKYLLLSLLFLFISIYFYSTAQLFVFIFLLLVFIFYYPFFLKLSKKHFFIALLVSIILLSPFIFNVANHRAGYRFSYISIFANPTVPQQIDISRQIDAVYKNGQQVGLKTSIDSKLFHNKVLSWSTKFVNHYISSFSTDFLFLTGDKNLRQGFGEVGYLFIPDFFLIIAGFYFLSLQSNRNISSKILLLLLVIFLSIPIPFALTDDSATPHGTRLILMLPFLLIPVSFGIFTFFQKIKKIILKIVFGVIIFVLYFLCFLNFYHYYFYHFPQKSADQWHVGIKEVIQNTYQNNQTARVFYSNNYEPVLPFFLYWSKYLPKDNQNTNSRTVWQNIPGFTGRAIDSKYFFGHLEWNQFFESQKYYLPDTVFVIPLREKETVIKEINNFNKNGKFEYKMNILKEISPQYEMSEHFIIFNLH